MVARLGGEAGREGSADTQVQPFWRGAHITLRLKTFLSLLTYWKSDKFMIESKALHTGWESSVGSVDFGNAFRRYEN